MKPELRDVSLSERAKRGHAGKGIKSLHARPARSESDPLLREVAAILHRAAAQNEAAGDALYARANELRNLARKLHA